MPKHANFLWNSEPPSNLKRQSGLSLRYLSFTDVELLQLWQFIRFKQKIHPVITDVGFVLLYRTFT